ncbi:elongator complex protein 3 [Clostridium paraputrificum]|uniref:elongator complex protein 3 n=1 Tax=Clostridium paraputrificum TaxID=29363 RepID=UPI003D3465CB
MSKKYFIIPLFIPHEGCPHDCVFCNQDRISGATERVTTDKVIETVEEYLKTINRDNATIEISFFGGTFTAIKEERQRELLTIAKDYKEKGLIDKIRMSTRPDYIDDYILTYLKEYKVDIIELGVQSLEDKVLHASGRGHTAEDVERASKLIKEYGITLGHQIMPGLPCDNFDRDIETVRKSINMKPDICRIYPALVIKDTPMEIMYKNGIYKPYTLSEAVEISKVMYKMYTGAGVQVIRIGLQPTETIAEGKDVIDGPFHPAFRELVEGSLLADRIKAELKGKKEGTIKINSKDISKLYANKKAYFNEMLKEGYNLKVECNDTVQRGDLIIL